MLFRNRGVCGNAMCSLVVFHEMFDATARPISVVAQSKSHEPKDSKGTRIIAGDRARLHFCYRGGLHIATKRVLIARTQNGNNTSLLWEMNVGCLQHFSHRNNSVCWPPNIGQRNIGEGGYAIEVKQHSQPNRLGNLPYPQMLCWHHDGNCSFLGCRTHVTLCQLSAL